MWGFCVGFLLFVCVCVCFKSNFMLRYNVWTATVSQSCRTFVRLGAVTAVQGRDPFTRLEASLYGANL